MDTRPIERLIAEHCEVAGAHDDLRELLAAVAEASGRVPDETDLDNGVRFVDGYVRQVPYICKVAWTAAGNVGLEREMRRILEAVESYWIEDVDVIPDHLGIIGLLDDAYCSLALLQAVSDHFQLQSGKFLFPDDLTEANRAMRRVIGEPYATELDRLVAGSLGEADILSAVKTLASPEKRAAFEFEATIWSHGPVSRQQVEELAALGLLGRDLKNGSG